MARLSPCTRRDGFTLIELLVVILIIGILVAVSAPSFLGQTKKAHSSASEQRVALAYRAAKAYAVKDSGNDFSGFDASQLASSEPELSGKVSVSESGGVLVLSASESGQTCTWTGTADSPFADGLVCGDSSGGGSGDSAPSLNSAPDMASSGDLNNITVGDTLTFTIDWQGSPTPTVSYQWMRCPSNNLDGSCTQVGGDSPSYTVLAGDAGQYLNLEVFATNTVSTVEYTANTTSNYGPVAAAPAPPSYASVVLADNPSGFWRLDEASGTSVANSGTGASADDGTSGCVTFFNPPSFGGCAQTPTLGVAGATSDGDTALQIHRSGSDSSTVMVPTAADFDTASFSVDGWVYLPTANTPGGLAGNADGGGSGWELASTGSGAITLYASSRGNVCTKSLLAAGWNYVAASWDDATGTVNCVTANSTYGYTNIQTVIGSSRSTQTQYSGWHFYLGTNPAMSGSLTADGVVIDDLAVYPSALPNTTFLAHYAAR